jgi:5'-nucleotidase
VKVGSEPLNLERKYNLVTRGYMGRGKDGYTSLLVKPEGGECEEIVSEENGVLISTILRQYFLSLKVLGKWKLWGPSLTRTWKAVHEEIHDIHPVFDPKPPPQHFHQDTTHATLDESEDGEVHSEPASTQAVAQDMKLDLMRKVSLLDFFLAREHFNSY